jgi:hypothetical protein
VGKWLKFPSVTSGTWGLTADEEKSECEIELSNPVVYRLGLSDNIKDPAHIVHKSEHKLAVDVYRCSVISTRHFRADAPAAVKTASATDTAEDSDTTTDATGTAAKLLRKNKPPRTLIEAAAAAYCSQIEVKVSSKRGEHVSAMMLACDYILSFLYFAAVHEVKHAPDCPTTVKATSNIAAWNREHTGHVTWADACEFVVGQLRTFSRTGTDISIETYIKNLFSSGSNKSIVYADIVHQLKLSGAKAKKFRDLKNRNADVDVSEEMAVLLETISKQCRQLEDLPRDCAAGNTTHTSRGLIKYFAHKLQYISNRDSQTGSHRVGFLRQTT